MIQSLIRAVLSGIILVAAAFAAAALTACQSIDPAPDVQVVLQSNGFLDERPASLYLRTAFGGMYVEVLANPSQRLLVRGFIQRQQITDLMADVRGPIESNLTPSNVLNATMRGCTERVVRGITGPLSNGATEGTFRFEGARKIKYNTGFLERSIDGQVHFTLRRADGSTVSQYTGGTSLQTTSQARGFVNSPNLERLAVATDVMGEISGELMSAGAPFLQPGPTRLSIIIPNGAGRVELDGKKQAFEFNPVNGLVPPGGAGESQMLTQNEDYVEFVEHFQAHINGVHATIPVLNLLGQQKHDSDGSPRVIPATGSGDIRYSITIAITPDRVLVVGNNSLHAALRGSNGARAEFRGSNRRIQTELAW